MVIDPLGGGGGGEGEVKPRGSSRHTQTPPSLLHHGGAWVVGLGEEKELPSWI